MNISELQSRISEKFTESVLLDILKKKSGCKNVTIRDVKFGPGAKKGDSYLSTVTKFSVTAVGTHEGSGDNKEIEEHIIVKSIPKNIARTKTFRSVDFFANESAFYNTVWPALNMFQQSKNLKNHFTSIPQCLYVFTDGTNDFIALEDVSFRGFRDLGRASGLDYEQAKLIIKVFARFHALSLAFKDQHPSEFESMAMSLQETYYAEKFRGWYTNTMNNLYAIARDAVKKELPESYSKKLEECLSKDQFTEVGKLCKNHGKFAAITQGDCWAPNFLIKFDQDSTTALAAIIIDYQLARYSSLSMDVLFFLLMCLDKPTREKHWNDLVKDYHQELVAFVKELGSDEGLFTLEALEEDMKRTGMFGFFMCLEGKVMSQLDDDEVTDIDMIQGEEAVPLDQVWILRPFKNEAKRQIIADFFKYLVDNNFI